MEDVKAAKAQAAGADEPSQGASPGGQDAPTATGTKVGDKDGAVSPDNLYHE